MNAPTLPARRRLRTAAGLVGASVAFLAGASAAEAACPTAPTTKALAQFGDQADYTLAPGGSFESGSAAWTLTGASVVSGNEPWKVGKSTDARSLSVSAKGKAVSPKFCVGVEHPTFRLFARRTTGTWGTMLVKLRWTESSGKVNETTITAIDGGMFSTWGLSKPLPLATTLPLWMAGQSVSAQIVLDPEDFGGNWVVDDAYIDPYRRS